MKYIVTGAAGLIGSGIVWGLNQRGEEDILAVDHLGLSDKWKNLRALKYADYLEKNMLLEDLDNLADDTKVIIHMGACSATTERDASYLIENNFEYTKQLAMFAAERSIRFIYASSCATYGDGTFGYNDNEDELDKLRPMNMYGYSKQMFDLWAKRQGLLSQITGVKFSNVYGCNEHHKGEMRSVVRRARLNKFPKPENLNYSNHTVRNMPMESKNAIFSISRTRLTWYCSWWTIPVEPESTISAAAGLKPGTLWRRRHLPHLTGKSE